MSRFDCTYEDFGELVECLRKQDAEKLVKEVNNMFVSHLLIFTIILVKFVAFDQIAITLQFDIYVNMYQYVSELLNLMV